MAAILFFDFLKSIMHKQFMLAALEQAYLGRGFCSPNPAVGAVVVHQGEIIAKSQHQGAGTAHAEQRVLQLLPENLKNLTLYVTLEPCNHWGKTPPCVSAIINSGVSTVVYAFKDPNPLVAVNDTPRILKEHGIEVIWAPMPEIDDFYRSYEYWMRTKKPWVTAKIAQSFDGKIAASDGKPATISNEACRVFTHKQRLYSDVILTTARTVLNDDPALTVRLGDKPISKPIAILDTHLSVSDKQKLLKTAEICHIFHDKMLEAREPLANCQYHGLPLKSGQLPLNSVLESLGELGFHDVWVEAGGRLFSALHEQGLVQTTYLYLAPTILGEDAPPAYTSSLCFKRPFTIKWQAEADNIIACLQWQKDINEVAV